MSRTTYLAIVLVVLPTNAQALELNIGGGLGALQYGSAGYFAISPQLGLVYGRSPGMVLTVIDTMMLLPTSQDLGINNQTSIGGGYHAEAFAITIGGMLAIYRAFSCGTSSFDNRRRCGHVAGFGPGGYAQLNIFLQQKLGFSVRGSIAWQTGDSLVPSHEVAWSVVTGPVLRWDSEKKTR